MLTLSRYLAQQISLHRIVPACKHISAAFRSNHQLPFQRQSFLFCTEKPSLKDSDQTFKLLIGRLEQKAKYAQELQKQMSEEASTSFDKKMSKQQIRIEISKLTPLRNVYDQIKNHLQNIKDSEELINDTKDKQQKQLLTEQIKFSKQKLEQLRQECWQLLISAAPYDNADDVLLQFRPGAGGSESSIFVQDISQMYESYCIHQGWRITTSSAVKQSGVTRGYKALDLRVQGPGVHRIMKCQAGVHKVIRVPETQAKGRLHSSTISLVVMPVVPFSFELDVKDIKYQYTKSSGPGGQAVNKIQSACRATHIPTGLAVFIQEERSQQMNKKRATDLLKQKLFELQYKKSMEEEQSKRKSQVTTLDRSQKIRTYNYPQDRITDHRTGLTKFGIRAMMNGQLLEQFITAYVQSVQNDKINVLIQQLYEDAGITIPKN